MMNFAIFHYVPDFVYKLLTVHNILVDGRKQTISCEIHLKYSLSNSARIKGEKC